MIGARISVGIEPTRFHRVDSFSALQLQIHDDLRAQHPEWVEANGESPMCDFYEERLAHLLEPFAHPVTDNPVAAIRCSLEEQTFINDLSVLPAA